MFKFFSRKPGDNSSTATTQGSQQATDTAYSLLNQQLRTPSPSATSAIGKSNLNASPLLKPGEDDPPITPSPPPDGLLDELGLISDLAALHSLISSIPPKILHEYTLSHLIPPARSAKPIHPPSSLTLTHLTSFFSSLTPPPRLHCVRCHKFYYDVENDMRSCLVPHDDDSAEVERVGGQYETLFGCCGKTVEGDGDMGPPDGWCYEGKHTTDTKRARFRSDSTIHDDKLTSCDRLKCYEPPVSEAESSSSAASSPRPRKRKRSTRKREDVEIRDAEADAADDDDDARSVTSTRSQTRIKKLRPSASSASLSAKPRKKRAKTATDDKAFKPEATPSEDDMDVDDSASIVSTKSKSKRATTSIAKSAKSRGSGGQGQGQGEGKGKARASANSKPISRKLQNVSPPPPPSTSISSPSSPARANTASPVAPEKPRKPKPTVTFQTTEVVLEGHSRMKSGLGLKPRSSSVKGLRAGKKLEEVVDTSVDGEM